MSVRGLSAGYSRDANVVDEVAFEAPRGRVTALLGPNGAGKSTLLKAVLGLLPSTGAVLLDGDSVAGWPAGLRAQRIAYVPQQSLLTARLSVRSVVGMGRFARERVWSSRGKEDRDAIQKALDQANV
ncbi:MAG TPA: iron ABC transporter ATP-binding protein, partial [Deltaproteobacteria bacterium]|nr:iron ABC transporter ATP-binding protein [Deltaproteobacteria bacterium]